MTTNWLEQIVIEQNAIAARIYGNPNMVNEAAHATDFFSEDELELATLSNVSHGGN